ncbi:hypothetical protein ACOMHN_054160 [Nucella lapillus]
MADHSYSVLAPLPTGSPSQEAVNELSVLHRQHPHQRHSYHRGYIMVHVSHSSTTIRGTAITGAISWSMGNGSQSSTTIRGTAIIGVISWSMGHSPAPPSEAQLS